MKHIQTKQPNEVIPCIMDFIKSLPEGESIDTFDVKVYDESGVDVSLTILSGTPSKVGTQVRSVVKAGADGEDYTVTFQGTTTPSGYILEEDVELQVRD